VPTLQIQSALPSDSTSDLDPLDLIEWNLVAAPVVELPQSGFSGSWGGFGNLAEPFRGIST
jgi:hypothetical protein